MVVGLTEAELEMRRTGIGASEIAAIAGLSRWSTPIDIYASKVLALDKDKNLKMELGDLFEEPIAILYGRRTGRQNLTRPGTLRSAAHSFALATPDRAVHTVAQPAPHTQDWSGVERLMQAKSTSWHMRDLWRDPEKDPTGVPEDFLAQVTWEMGVTGIRLCDLAVLFDREDFRVYTIPFDATFFESLVELANRFWVDHVEARRPPPPDASDGYAEFLRRYYPTSAKGEMRPVEDPALAESIRNLRALELRAKSIEAEIKLEKNRVKDAIGSAEGLVTEFGNVTWKTTKGTTKTKWEQVARRVVEHLPPAIGEQVFGEAVNEYTKVVPGHRRLHKPWSRETEENE